MQAKDNKLTISDPSVLEKYQPGSRKKTFWVGLAIIAVVAIAIILWVAWGVKNRESEFEANIQKRLELIADSQVHVMDAMIEATVEQANRVINSELYKLYAAEIHLIEDDVALLVSGPLPGQEELSHEIAQLSAQLPMMQSLLIEFTRFSGYTGARIVNRNGTVFISTDAATTPLRSDQNEMAQQVFQMHAPRFAPLRYSEQGMIMEAYLPIFPPDASGLDPVPVSVLLLTKDVSENINALERSKLMEPGERTRLLQRGQDGYQEVAPWTHKPLQKINTPPEFDENGKVAFSVRSSLGGETKAYSIGEPVSGPDWWIFVEADYDISREELRGQQKALMSIAALLVLVFAVAFGAFWATFVGHQERKVSKYFEQLAAKIEQQRQLLDRINNTISDYIVLKDLQGRYRYVNPAFAEAVGRSPEELVGLDNEAVFGYDTAKRLEQSDQQVLTSGEPVTFNEQLYLQSEPHHLQISKAALKDTDGRLSGIVSVIRDITELVEVQRRQEQATAKSIEALVRAIELTDPYLAGHSKLMGRFAVEIAKGMNASDLDIATVEIAANLSQVGKLFVDRELLYKTEALTAEEKSELEKHVEHAAKVLQDIDFGLPVFKAVSQMNETLDGKGYPKGLKGDELSLPARILAVANSFCAMVVPRAYRAARSVDESLQIIEQGDGAYDQRVVGTLKEVVKSSIGEKLLAQKQQD